VGETGDDLASHLLTLRVFGRVLLGYSAAQDNGRLEGDRVRTLECGILGAGLWVLGAG
jgi:hypothetical protein